MVEVVPHDGGGLVEEPGDFGVLFLFEELGQEFDIVAPAGFDELLLDGCALFHMENLLAKFLEIKNSTINDIKYLWIVYGVGGDSKMRGKLTLMYVPHAPRRS